MNCIIIGIAGGSGSGKSTFTNRLLDLYKDKITVIYHDNYYKKQDKLSLEERKKTNYDHPDSLDTKMLVEHIKKLKEGEAIECPIYDYSIHNRKAETVKVKPSPIIIVEGILALQDKKLRELMDIKIFVDADADERIIRRILRDVRERGRDMEGIIAQYLETVKPMHYIYVEPTKSMADIIINDGRNDVALDLIRTKIDCLLSDEKCS